MANSRMTKEEFKLYKKQCEMCKDEIYADYPEVRKFEESKKRWVIFLMIFCLVLTIIKIYALNTLYEMSAANIFSAFMSQFTPSFIFLACALGKWRFAIPLYFLSMLILGSPAALIVRAVFDGTLMELFWLYKGGFAGYPLQVTADLLTLVYGILILITSIRLTFISKNRDLSDQQAVLDSRLKQEISRLAEK